MKPDGSTDLPPSALHQEMLRAHAKLLSIARSLTGNREDAADLVQATCLRALERSSTLRNRSNLLGWMMQVMRNLHLDNVRRPGRRWVPLEHEPELREEPIGAWRKVDDADIAAGAARLIPIHRAVWQLAFDQRLNQGDIAARRGIPRATRFFRARAALKHQLLRQHGHREASVTGPT